MSTLKTHNLQSPDAGSVNIALTANAGMIVAGVTTFSSNTLVTDGSSYSITSGSSGVFAIAASEPRIRLIDNESNPNYSIYNTSGVFRIHDETSAVNRLTISSSGNVSILNDLDVDGHTNLDNVSIAGVTTITGASGTLLQVSHTGGSGGQGIIRTKASQANSSSFIRAEDSGTTYIGLLKYGTGHSAYGALGAGDGALYANSGGGNNTNITIMADSATGYINFATGGNTEKLRIDSNGFMGLGTNNPSSFNTYARDIVIARSSGDAGLTISAQDASSEYGSLHFSGGTTVRAYIDMQNGTTGRMFFMNKSNGYTAFGTNNTERLRIDSSGNLALGNTHAAKRLHISNTGNQKVLIDPNYNNNSGGSSNAEANANNIVESMLIRTSYGENAASQTNAGHKWGIKFQGYNGNDFTQAISKCAGVFAVSEDEAGGYNRNVGLTFHTSPYNTNHREVMRINTNGIVTKPYQYVFTVSTTNHSKTANWSKITNMVPIAAQCTNVSDGTNWSNSTQRFTAPVAGVYHFFVGGWSYGNSNGTRYGYCFRHTNNNGFQFIGGGDYCSADSPMTGWSRTIKLAKDEWVELWGYSAIAVRWGGGHEFFWGGYLLG